MTKIFDVSTIQGIRTAERFKDRMNDEFDSVSVYSLGFNRVQIVALRPIVSSANCGQDPQVVPDRQ